MPATLPGLRAYFRGLGLPEAAWHIGPEHPALEELALGLLARTARRVLELGVQSGGFAVPVVLASGHRPGFRYVGVDNLAYANAVPLGLIAEYLALHGLADRARFVEGDSSAVLRAAAPDSYDLILLDHDKPKYPLDLHRICARHVLSADGAVLLHDVLTHAAAAWRVCERVCRAFGYEWTIDAGVSQGVAIVRRGPGRGSPARGRLARAEAAARWAARATVRRGRRAAGRILRSAGLRGHRGPA
jgi:predicted O-methyltransferase YrrM